MPRTFLLALSLAAVVLSGCSLSNVTSAIDPGASSELASSQVTARDMKSSVLYVANSEGTVNVYRLDGHFLRGISNGISVPEGIAVDKKGDLYVANYGTNTVTVYGNQGKTLLRTISQSIGFPIRVALDSKGNLYVLNRLFVTVYKHGTSSLMRKIKVRGASIALDASDKLYVGEMNTIYIYAAGGRKPESMVTNGVGFPRTLAFDGAGNLYVGNEQVIEGPCDSDVTVFPPGSDQPTLTIAQGVCDPTSLAFDATGNLYVANNVRDGSFGDDVTVYSTTTGSLLTSISQGIEDPISLAFDGQGNLYTGNKNSVTVYAPGSYTLLKTISSGIDSPSSIKIGS